MSTHEAAAERAYQKLTEGNYMPEMDEGLFQKYNVTRVDGKPVGWTFTLEEHDPLAIPALIAYAKAANAEGFHHLAADLWEKIAGMKSRLAP